MYLIVVSFNTIMQVKHEGELRPPSLQEQPSPFPPHTPTACCLHPIWVVLFSCVCLCPWTISSVKSEIELYGSVYLESNTGPGTEMSLINTCLLLEGARETVSKTQDSLWSQGPTIRSGSFTTNRESGPATVPGLGDSMGNAIRWAPGLME